MVNVAVVLLWIVTFLVVAILAVATIRVLSNNSDSINSSENFISPSSTPPFPSQYIYFCTQDSECITGLKCDISFGECRIAEGGKCNSFSDCISGTYCSGICINEENLPNINTLIPGDPCPCGSDFICDESDSNKKICLKKTGTSCTMNLDCFSEICDSGLCSAGLEDGKECTSDNQCLNRNCSLGWCQPRGEITSEIGSTCNVYTPDCNNGLICSNAGNCVPITNGLTLSCNENVGCPNYFTCYNIPVKNSNGNYPNPGSPGGFDLCNPDGTGCICLFTTDLNTVFPRPNLESQFNGTCIPGYIPDIAGQYCLAPFGDPCSVNGNCQSNNCVEGSNIYKIEFELNSESCSPLSGNLGEINQNFSELPVPPGPVLKLIGATLGFRPPVDSTCMGIDKGTDVIYVISYGGFNDAGVSDSTTLWKLVSGSYTSVLKYEFKDSLGNSIRFTDADVVEFNGSELVLITGIDMSTGTSKLFSLNSSIPTPYLTIDGRQKKEGGDYISFDSISITNIQENPGYPGILVYSVGSYIHYNAKGNIFRSENILTGSNPEFIQLSYGIKKDSSGIRAPYPLMTYVSGSEGNRFVRFTQTLNGSVDNMSNIKYPPALNGMSISNVTVYGYSISKSNPITELTQYGFFVGNVGGVLGDTALYVISSGIITAIPGYLDMDSKLLATTSNLYFFTPKSCV